MLVKDTEGIVPGTMRYALLSQEVELGRVRLRSNKNYPLGYMEQTDVSRVHEASPQSRLSAGCKRYSRSKKSGVS